MTDIPKADLFEWLDKMFVPPLRHLLTTYVNKAVGDAERPLRVKIRELETELARTRADVARAVGDQSG